MIVIVHSFFSHLQRAVLAEKELSVLKEQFEESSKRLSTDQANEAPPPIMDTPLDVMGRPSLLELAAKEKEVRYFFTIVPIYV